MPAPPADRQPMLVAEFSLQIVVLSYALGFLTQFADREKRCTAARYRRQSLSWRESLSYGRLGRCVSASAWRVPMTDRFRLVACLAATACLAAVDRTRADIISVDWIAAGDNLLTRDLVTGREWLDLTETLLPEGDADDLPERFAQFLSRLEPGGDLIGFRVAGTSDVVGLAISAGVEPGTRDIAVNGLSAATLATLAGSPHLIVDLSENVRVTALTENPGLRSVRISYIPAARNSPEASIAERTALSATSVWVYREPIPEPTSLTLSSILPLASALRLRGARWRTRV